jgi:multidrug efflux pump subunit AcrB
MWLVRIALHKPYTFIVFALLILIIGILSIIRMPTDIFPSINIPVISVIWNYKGMPPDEISDRITNIFERAVTTTVYNIDHIESDSYTGISLTKLFFSPFIDRNQALSEVTAISQTLLKLLPPGITPPQILIYDASTVPVMNLLLSSSSLPEHILNDFGSNIISTQLATIQGAALPSPYGGKIRQIMIDLDPKALQAYQLSAQYVIDAFNQQSLILPSGTQKIGQYEYLIKMNAMPRTMEEFNAIPIKQTSDGIIYLRDVAHVRDGYPPQTNIVRVNGQRAVMMPILKTGTASALDIIARVKQSLKHIKQYMPESLELSILGDQSMFINAAIHGVITEACIAAILTSLMIFLFIGHWRSTAVIALSIPLSILASLSMLSCFGQTINIMTLGGLALAVGILVDDATVTIENINGHLERGKTVEQAILDGADQIAIPALVSTLAICIVFIPMFYLGGVAEFLFVPFAMAVIFAMLTSYLLSRTLVPTLAKYILQPNQLPDFQFIHAVALRFEALREQYRSVLTQALKQPGKFVVYFGLVFALSLVLLWPWLGENFFPQVDTGQIKLHFEGPTGTRIEETARLADEINAVIRQTIPKNELESIADNIGLPISGISLSYSNSGTLGPEDGDIMIALREGHRAKDYYIPKLRRALMLAFPQVQFSFLPADIVNQILNFGLPAPINVAISGLNMEANRAYAYTLLKKLKHISGIVDARVKQHDDYPSFFVNIDRTKSKELGLNTLDVVSNLFLSLSGSFQTRPNFWVDPASGISYFISGQVPQYKMDSLQALNNITLNKASQNDAASLLASVATITRTTTPVVVSHYNVQPLYNIYADIQGHSLGTITQALKKLLKQEASSLPKGSKIALQGQISTQESAFHQLYFGLLLSVLFVYLLIVVNFQSWKDPFIIIMALPAALAGIAWMLFLTRTTLSVPALIGSIMAMGIATANSILVISFAKQQLRAGFDPLQAIINAAVNRLRPVLMTALAMLLGMLPMSFAFTAGSEQNVPLARAVIGGLSFATVATLFFVPLVFYIFYRPHYPTKGQL